MSFPAPTTGVGVAAQVKTTGNFNSGNSKPGYNSVRLSLSGTNGPTTYQLNPVVTDAAGTPIAPGTALVLSAVAASVPGVLTLSAAAINGVYTGTITGGATNGLAGYQFTVAGFSNAANNGTFLCTASTGTTLTLNNVNSVAETKAATAQALQGTAVYTGTITGGATNALAGKTFVVSGFPTAANNGTFEAVASSGTTLTLVNPAAVAQTNAATATPQETTNNLTYVVYGSSNIVNGVKTPIVTVSSTGLLTAVARGRADVEVSFPTFNNAAGNVVSAGNIMNGLPKNKVFSEFRVTVEA